jgi:hypothetical protein
MSIEDSPNAMAKDLQIHKMTALGPMQGKSQVWASVCVFFFSQFLYCGKSGKPPQTNLNLIGTTFCIGPL